MSDILGKLPCGLATRLAANFFPIYFIFFWAFKLGSSSEKVYNEIRTGGLACSYCPDSSDTAPDP